MRKMFLMLAMSMFASNVHAQDIQFYGSRIQQAGTENYLGLVCTDGANCKMLQFIKVLGQQSAPLGEPFKGSDAVLHLVSIERNFLIKREQNPNKKRSIKFQRDVDSFFGSVTNITQVEKEEFEQLENFAVYFSPGSRIPELTKDGLRSDPMTPGDMGWVCQVGNSDCSNFRTAVWYSKTNTHAVAKEFCNNYLKHKKNSDIKKICIFDLLEYKR